MNSQDLRLKRRFLHAENKKYGDTPVEIPREQWPTFPFKTRAVMIGVYRSSRFLIQKLMEHDMIRLSVIKAELNDDGGWKDGITWDELQKIKHQLGFGERFAVEIYPSDSQIVNVANIRHLWIFPENQKPYFAWIGREGE